jgi:uncharacterized membrane protein
MLNHHRDTAPSAFETAALPPLLYSRITAWIVAVLGGLIVGVWLFGTPPGLLGKADAVGYAVCHRIAVRSFHVHDRPLPLCARCTGTYLGVITGLLTFAAQGRLRAGRLPRIRILLALLVGVAAYGIDGLNSYLSLFDAYTPIYQPTNTLRLITGYAFGLAMIAVVVPVFNMMVWREPQPAAPLRSMKELATLVAFSALVIAAVLIQVPALLIAFGLISAAGVLVMFCVVGCALFLTLTGHENSAARWRDLVIPALAGLVFAVSVIGAIDAVRYLFTGTWNGFTLPG